MSQKNEHSPTERFSNRAKLYAQARPDYPEEALDFICSHCQLDQEKLVLDIGAGTGISTRALAKRGMQVVGIEPNEAMLNEAMDNPQFKDKIKYIKATAEETGLLSASYDAIFCAQAFHWFNPDKALSEFQRLLKPSGWLLLIWNERDESDIFTKTYGELLLTLPDTSRVEVHRGKAGQTLLETKLFANQSKQVFANEQKLELDKFLGRAFSASYVPAPGTPHAAEFELKLRSLFDQFQAEGSIVMKYECSVYCGQNKAN